MGAAFPLPLLFAFVGVIVVSAATETVFSVSSSAGSPRNSLEIALTFVRLVGRGFWGSCRADGEVVTEEEATACVRTVRDVPAVVLLSIVADVDAKIRTLRRNDAFVAAMTVVET